MNKILLVAAMMVVASGASFAADDVAEPMVVSESLEVAGSCSPLPPVVSVANSPCGENPCAQKPACVKAPVCVETPVCADKTSIFRRSSATAVCAPVASQAVAAAEPVEETYFEVPVKKKVKAQEVYTVNEKRTKTEMEVRTKVIKPNSPRLVRTAKGGNGSSALRVHKDLPREKTYLKPVKSVYEVPVTKTRDITIEVEEKTLVPASRMHRR